MHNVWRRLVNKMSPNQQEPSAEGEVVKQKNHNDPTFLGVPLEIRNMIYTYLFPASITATGVRKLRMPIDAPLDAHYPDYRPWGYSLLASKGQHNAIPRLMQVSWQILEEIETLRPTVEENMTCALHEQTSWPTPKVGVGEHAYTGQVYWLQSGSMPYWSLKNLRRLELSAEFWLEARLFVRTYSRQSNMPRINTAHCLRLSLSFNREDAVEGDNHRWMIDESSVNWTIGEEGDVGLFTTQFLAIRQDFMTYVRGTLEQGWREEEAVGPLSAQLLFHAQCVLDRCFSFDKQLYMWYQGILHELSITALHSSTRALLLKSAENARRQAETEYSQHRGCTTS